MTAYQPIDSAGRECAEIDALVRALTNLRHWSAAADSRRSYVDDQGRRLHASARTLRDAAWANCLAAAYHLFEIDAIHAAWRELDGGCA